MVVGNSRTGVGSFLDDPGISEHSISLAEFIDGHIYSPTAVGYHRPSRFEDPNTVRICILSNRKRTAGTGRRDDRARQDADMVRNIWTSHFSREAPQGKPRSRR